MRKAKIFLILICMSVHATADEQCIEPTKLEQLKSFISCQSNLKLASCGVLGAAVAGRVITKAYKKSKANKAAAKAAQAGLKGAMYGMEAFLKEVLPGKNPTLRNKMGSINTSFFFKDDVAVSTVMDAIEAQVAKGGELDSAFISRTNTKVRNALDQSILKARAFKDIPNLKQISELVQSAVYNYKQAYEKEAGAALKRSFNGASSAIGKTLQKKGTKAVLGAALGGGIGLALWLGSPSSLSCSAELNNEFLNLDEYCQPIYKVNGEVLSFLNRSTKEQTEYLNGNYKACQYYKKLWTELFKIPKLKGLDCSEGKTAILIEDQGKEIRQSLSFYENGEIKNINFAEEGSFGVSRNTGLKFTNDGSLYSFNFSKPEGSYKVLVSDDSVQNQKAFGPRAADIQQASQWFSSSKLYALEAKACCESQGADQRACQADFGTKKSPGSNSKNDGNKSNSGNR